MTTRQPAASAGATLRVIMASGKFQGVIAAHTPMGCLSTIRRRLLSNCGRVSPLTRLASSAYHSTKLAAYATSPLASGSGLPCSAVMMRAEVVLVCHEQIEPFAQDDAALFGGLGAPGGPGCVGRGDGSLGILRTQVGNFGKVLAVAGSCTAKRLGPASHSPLIRPSVFRRVGSLTWAEGGCGHVHGGCSIEGLWLAAIAAA